MAGTSDDDNVERGSDNRRLALLTRGQANQLAEGVEARRKSRGWPTGGGRDRAPRYSTAIYNDLVVKRKRPRLGPYVDAWDARMRWKPGSALQLALRGTPPVLLEDMGMRAREAIERRCAERGWDLVRRIDPDAWAILSDARQPELPDQAAIAVIDAAMEWLPGSTASVADGGEVASLESRLAALRYEIVLRRQQLPSDSGVSTALWDIIGMAPTQLPTTQQHTDLDIAMQWAPGSSEGIVYRGRSPVGLEDLARTVVTIELDGPPGVATFGELWTVIGDVMRAVERMEPGEVGQMAAVLRQMLEWHLARLGPPN